MENTAVLALPAPAVTPILTKETYTKLVEDFQAQWEAVSEFVNNSLIPVIHKLMKRLYKSVAPPKLYHLAYHAKKGRTRKKNLKHIKCCWEDFINECNKIH